MNAKILSTTGRIMYCLPLVVFGLGHFMNTSAMAPMVPVPGGAIWLYITGTALIAAAVSILTKKMVWLSCLLLGLMLLIFALGVHLRGMLNAPDEMAKMVSMTSLIKDLGLSGAAFYLSGTNWKD